MKIYVEIQSIDEAMCSAVVRFYTDDFPQGTYFQNYEIRDPAALVSEQTLTDYLVRQSPWDWLKRMGEFRKNGVPSMAAVRGAAGRTHAVELSLPTQAAVPSAASAAPMFPVDET